MNHPDQNPAHYTTGLDPQDPRRVSDDFCVVCGLLSEFHRNTQQAIVWSPEYRKCHYHTVCSARCKERFFSLMDSLEKDPRYYTPVQQTS